MIEYLNGTLVQSQWLPPPGDPYGGVLIRRSRGLYIHEPEHIHPDLLAAVPEDRCAGHLHHGHGDHQGDLQQSATAADGTGLTGRVSSADPQLARRRGEDGRQRNQKVSVCGSSPTRTGDSDLA
jgi:hypothetical protein